LPNILKFYQLFKNIFTYLEKTSSTIENSKKEDKKQMIKDQLKLLEDALKKKKSQVK
jgi:hypothetical protein